MAGFSADGTRTDTRVPRSATGTGEQASKIEYQTQWRTALQNDCPGGPQEYHWHVQENSWIGGQKLISETNPPGAENGVCARFVPGANSQWQSGNEKATTWSRALGLAMGDISFEATAETGYDTSAQITYGFANATHVNWVCGTETVPSNAKRTVVQSHINP